MDVVSEAVAGMGEQLAILGQACEELSHPELIELLAGLATVVRSVPAVEQRALARLIAETEPARLGEASWKTVLTTALRVSGAEAVQRLKRAKTLGPRRGLTGQPLAPLWESTAAAQARGVLDAAHIAVIATFHKRLPSWVDVDTRAHADAQLAELGSGLTPEELKAAAQHLRNTIDQDGPPPSEDERARRRGVRFGPQQSDGFSSVSGWVSARCRAGMEALFAKEAAPGHNIPDYDVSDADVAEEAVVPDADVSGADAPDADVSGADAPGADVSGADAPGADVSGADAPGADVSGAEVPDAEVPDADVPDAGADTGAAEDRDADVPGAEEALAPAEDHDPLPDPRGSDTRTQAQRQHDALEALCYRSLASGEVGSHNGLPVTVIVSTTLQELEKGAGVAVTGGGSLLPMADLIRMAANAHHYLYVYDQHSGQSLYLARTKRLANAAQRIVLHARDRGCTRPGCTAPGYWCQAHHAVADWNAGGQTNVDEMTLACPPDHRMLDKTKWRTRKNQRNQTEWLPPPELDTGQHRVNGYHHPERYLLPEDDEGP